MPEEDQEIKKLLKENLEYTKQILAHTKKTRQYILLAQIFSIIKILIIVIPIVLGIIYLPPLIKDAFTSYGELLGFSNGGFIEQLEILQK